MNQAPSNDPENWLAEWLTRHEKPLLKYAFSHCSDRELSRDAVQETFLRLIRHHHQHQSPPHQVGAWLFTVCRNIISDHQRRAKIIHFPGEIPDTQDEQQPSPDLSLASTEQNSTLTRLIRELPERERELIRLKFNVGLSYREMQDVTGIKEGHIGYLLHHTLRQLRSRWERESTSPS